MSSFEIRVRNYLQILFAESEEELAINGNITFPSITTKADITPAPALRYPRAIGENNDNDDNCEDLSRPTAPRPAIHSVAPSSMSTTLDAGPDSPPPGTATEAETNVPHNQPATATTANEVVPDATIPNAGSLEIAADNQPSTDQHINHGGPRPSSNIADSVVEPFSSVVPALSIVVQPAQSERPAQDGSNSPTALLTTSPMPPPSTTALSHSSHPILESGQSYQSINNHQRPFSSHSPTPIQVPARQAQIQGSIDPQTSDVTD